VSAPRSPRGDGKAASPDLLPPSERDRERLVLIAHPEVEEAKAIGDALTSWGLDVRLAHDGVEAILGIQRSLPKLVILDAALPKMFGFQVCELVKRNESLREIAVVLVGAIHHEERYRRPPGELYGADAYLERQQVPEGLVPLMRELGLGRRRDEEPLALPGSPSVVATPARPQQAQAQTPAPKSVALAPVAQTPVAAAPVRARPPAPPAQPAPLARVSAEAPSAPAASPSAQSGAGVEQATAERLARIIVSDIVLYNAERFEAALASGEVIRAMASELSEGRGLLSQRVGATVDVAGLLETELVRVAQARGMT
jgi:CheY-like chemotaxis protein